ncbi:thioredoxin family protein [Cytobacillus gottheilii]|uniref:Thioredoxin family protein n=1 Tax=Cytobacillus gottheilii TaxID=859144 RepID=A0ABX8F9A3_9BACI|nr:thioredoxin family protein [Cytobacillus gottheilii]QVY61011.1 thioredoxin family protein [Cytobacillus gottheilii]
MLEWSQQEIESALKNDFSGFIYLYTPMCGTCQMAGKMLTVVNELLTESAIRKADLNYMPTLAEKWNVESVPCLLIVHNGEVTEKIYAFHSVPYLLEKMSGV